MSEFKIEKNVPMPPRLSNPGKYPWRQMEVGDSFFAPGWTAGRFNNNIQRVRLAVLPDSKWKCRTVTENGIEGVRVWRIA